MFIFRDPDEWVTEVEHGPNISVDPFGYAGTTIYSIRRATPEEYRKNRSARLKKEYEALIKRLHQVEFEMGNKPS
jgi:hypothetical protein